MKARHRHKSCLQDFVGVASLEEWSSCTVWPFRIAKSEVAAELELVRIRAALG